MIKKIKESFNTSIIIFLLIIFSFSFLSITKPVDGFSENENRFLAQMPKYSWKDLKSGKYTQEYEKYITDQFVYRDEWISVKTFSERALHKQDIKSIYIGKDGYLIERHESNNIDKEKEEKNINYLVDFIDNMNIEGKISLMLIPTASEILTNKLPPFANGYNQLQVIDRLKENIEDKKVLVDISKVLKDHKDEYIYYKTDHHWTSLAAYYSYLEWARINDIDALSQEEFNINIGSEDFYGTLHSKLNLNINPDTIYLYNRKEQIRLEHIADLKDKSDSIYDLSKLEIKDKYSVFLGGNHAMDEIKTSINNGKSLLIIKDSFAHSMVPFLINHYENIYLVDLRYINTNISDLISEKNITDVLVLYNIINFVSDNNMFKLNK